MTDPMYTPEAQAIVAKFNLAATTATRYWAFDKGVNTADNFRRAALIAQTEIDRAEGDLENAIANGYEVLELLEPMKNHAGLNGLSYRVTALAVRLIEDHAAA